MVCSRFKRAIRLYVPKLSSYYLLFLSLPYENVKNKDSEFELGRHRGTLTLYYSIKINT